MITDQLSESTFNRAKAAACSVLGAAVSAAINYYGVDPRELRLAVRAGIDAETLESEEELVGPSDVEVDLIIEPK